MTGLATEPNTSRRYSCTTSSPGREPVLVTVHVTVAVPQAEHGQGVYTVLPQILADELGADWRTVAVEPAPLNPLYANPLAADELFAGVFDRLPDGFRQAHARRTALVPTTEPAGSQMKSCGPSSP